MLFGSNMTGFFVVISVILALLTLAKWLGQLSQAGLTLTKWFLISVAGLVMVWGIYNVIGQRLGIWSPISLDAYLKPISDAIERFIEWLLDMLARFLKR